MGDIFFVMLPNKRLLPCIRSVPPIDPILLSAQAGPGWQLNSYSCRRDN
jgi:hypothetical protein